MSAPFLEPLRALLGLDDNPHDFDESYLAKATGFLDLAHREQDIQARGRDPWAGWALAMGVKPRGP